jgi:hypothetical protein
MGKVSIGLRGWRFDEEAIFEAAGQYRNLDEMDEEVRKRLIRLSGLVTESCDACWLAGREDANEAEYVYGEPMGEVVVCDDHEPDFVYWFRESGGDEFAGTREFDDRFHEWFADGGRAPEGYPGMNYVEGDAGDLKAPPELDEEYAGADILVTRPEERIDVLEGTVERFPEEADYDDPLEDDEDDVDISTEYPG